MKKTDKKSGRRRPTIELSKICCHYCQGLLHNPFAMAQKTIFLKTNYNHKLGCDVMIHLDLAPTSVITEEKMNETTFLFKTEDNSHPEVRYQMFDTTKTNLDGSMPWILPTLSHGMNLDEFITYMLDNRPGTKLGAEMRAYHYRIIKD